VIEDLTAYLEEKKKQRHIEEIIEVMQELIEEDIELRYELLKRRIRETVGKLEEV